MKPWPAHHKRVRVPFATVVDGYGGTHRFRGLPGLWQIIGADSEQESNGEAWMRETIALIVAPARGVK